MGLRAISVRSQQSEIHVEAILVMMQDTDSKSEGGDNQLLVALKTYVPEVTCRGTMGPEWNSCKDILGDMQADTREAIFGPRSDRTVEMGLPVMYDSSTPAFGKRS